MHVYRRSGISRVRATLHPDVAQAASCRLHLHKQLLIACASGKGIAKAAASIRTCQPQCQATFSTLCLCFAVGDASATFMLCACPDVPAGKDETGAAGGVLDQRWRYRVLSATVLPNSSRRGEIIVPEQALQLRVRLHLTH